MGVKLGARVYHIYNNFNFLHLLFHRPYQSHMARNFNSLRNCSHRFMWQFKPQHLVKKCFFSAAASRQCIVHSKSLYARCSPLLKKYPLLIWTCRFVVPLQAGLIVSHSVQYLKERLVLCGECASTYPLEFSSWPTVPIDPQPSHSSQIIAAVYTLREWMLTNLRGIRLILVFFPLLLIYPLTYISPGCFSLWLRLLYIGVEHSGATFIKLCQWASTRRDLFSKKFCDVFSGLNYNVRPHAWSHTVRVLKQAFGENWQQMLHLPDKQKPIGSGCIAQVYKGHISPEFVPLAVLKSLGKWNDKEIPIKDNEIRTTLLVGEHGDAGVSESTSNKVVSDKNLIPVAIKVLHPNIRETFDRDLKLMKMGAKYLTLLFPRLHWVNLNQCVEEFSITMHKQLDMRYESQCLQKFAFDFQSFPRVTVPQPIPYFVRHNILVETFEDGVSMCQILTSADHSSRLKKELAGMGLDLLLQMIFVNNFVHADLHPGNLLVQNIEHFELENVSQGNTWDTMTMHIRPEVQASLRLVMLDCGITTTLSPDDRLKFREVFIAVVKGQGEIVADLFLKKSPVNNCTDPELFRKEMAQLVTKSRQNLNSVSKIRVAELMNELFTVLSRHKIQLDSSFVTIVLAIAMLEGVGRTLDPNLNLMDRAKSVLLGSYFRK